MEERLPPLTFKCVKTFLAFKSLSVTWEVFLGREQRDLSKRMARYFRNLKVLETLSLLNSPTRLMCCRLYNFSAFLFARKAMSSICWRWRRMNFIWFPGKTFSAGFQGSGVGLSLQWGQHGEPSILECLGLLTPKGGECECPALAREGRAKKWIIRQSYKTVRKNGRNEREPQNHPSFLNLFHTCFVYFLWRPCDLGCAGFDMWAFVRGVMYALYVVKYPWDSCHRRDQRTQSALLFCYNRIMPTELPILWYYLTFPSHHMPTSTLDYNHVYILMCFFLGITLIGKSPIGKLGDLPMVGKYSTFQGTSISHFGKRKIIFKMPFLGDMLIPWRVDLGGLFFRFKVYGSVALLKSAKPTLSKTRPLTAWGEEVTFDLAKKLPGTFFWQPVKSWFPTISYIYCIYKDLVHHPIETTIYKMVGLGFQVLM